VKTLWSKLGQALPCVQREFLNDMFFSDVEKMCFCDISNFVTARLSRPDFKEQVSRYCKKEEVDDDMNVNFTFEFLLV
jgi:hypothetical protein